MSGFKLIKHMPDIPPLFLFMFQHGQRSYIILHMNYEHNNIYTLPLSHGNL